jgi:PAS domain S-box-containing protein
MHSRVPIVVFVYTVAWIALHFAGGWVTQPGNWRSVDLGAGLVAALLLTVGPRWSWLVAAATMLGIGLFPVTAFFNPGRIVLISLSYGLLCGLSWGLVRRRVTSGVSPFRFPAFLWLIAGAFGVPLALVPLVWMSRFLPGAPIGPRARLVSGLIATVWGIETVGVLTVAPALMVYVVPRFRQWFGLPDPVESAADQPALLQDLRSACDYMASRNRAAAQRRPPLDLARLLGFTALIALSFYVAAWLKYRYGMDFLYISLLPLYWVAVRHGIPLTSVLLLTGNYAVLVVFRYSGWLNALPVIDMRILLASSSLLSLALAGMVAELQSRSEQLADNDNRLQAVYNAEPEGICLLEKDGTLLGVNQSGLKMLGASEPGEIVGRPMSQLLGVADFDPWAQIIERAGAGESCALVYEAPEPPGSRWLESHVSPLRDAQGNIEALLAVTRDNTRRKQDEDALRLSEEKFAKVFRSSPDALAISTPDGRVLEVNEAFLRIVKYSRGEVVGRTVRDLELWVNPELRDKTLRIAESEGLVRNVPFQFRTKTGEIREGLYSGHSLDVQGQRCWLTAARDVTDYLQLEEQFRQTQQQEAVGRLAGGVAHDFNNILTVIHGYSALVAAQLPRESPYQASLRTMHQASEKAARLTQQLLLFSRQDPIRLAPLHLNGVLSDLEGLLRTTLGEDIELVVLPTAPWSIVNADPGLIRHSLMNLAVHAREAMPGGGTLTIRTERHDQEGPRFLERPEIPQGRYVALVVQDTGRGFEADKLAHIFEPYASSVVAEKEVALELVLSTVHSIIKQMEGYIWADSQLGQGTTFHILLPWLEWEDSPRTSVAGGAS